jgi:hypothetical protein
MRNRLLGVVAVVAVVIATAGLLRTARVPADVSSGPAPRTPWGEPDLQGIWTDPATKDTATDFGNEGGADALTGNGGAIF